MTTAPKPVRLVISCLAREEAPRVEAVELLTKRFGSLDRYSEPMAFTDTDYYTPEMGGPLTRRVASFESLVEPHRLADIKGVCEGLEQELAEGNKRRVNIDPGLLSEHSLILATHKIAPHRIALTDRIWAELTLWFTNGEFQSLPWTYPDYRGSRLKEIFFLLRQRYLWQLNKTAS